MSAELLTVREAADLAGCTVSAVYHALGRRLRVASYRPFRMWRADVLRWMELRALDNPAPGRWEAK